MSAVYDLAIVGSGFAGSLLAMIARRCGRSVLLLEKGKHPRFAIGESSTPLANLLLEELAGRYGLPRLTPLTKWGTWQQTYPRIPCGLKRGFSFFHHTLDGPAPARFSREQQLLVAASPHDRISDTHWYRSAFDHFLVQEARDAGVDYFDEVGLSGISQCSDPVSIEGERSGKPVTFRAKFLIDATGPRGFLHRALGLPELSFPDFPATEGLYSHFSDVNRFGNTQQPESGELPPYPADDAALHHVFDGGWIWVLRFNNGLTSAGVAAGSEVAERLRFSDGAPAWNRLLELLPAVRRQFSSAQPVRPMVHARRLSFLSGAIAGSGWALLPAAAAFVDPLLSTGFPLALLGVERLAEMIERDWGTERWAPRLNAYADHTKKEALAAARLIGALYASMGNFPLFTSLSLLYFAAASFAETARRLNKRKLASSFLLCGDPRFGPALDSLCARARAVKNGLETQELCGEILRTIEPFNVAGLGTKERRNWYPADANDLLRAASKLGTGPDGIARMLERSGFGSHYNLLPVGLAAK